MTAGPVFHVEGRAEVDGHASTWWDEYGPGRTDENAANLDRADPYAGNFRIPTDRGNYLDLDDLYFRDVAASAQAQYGDPNIHYAETGPNGAKRRFLAFGNGQALPQDGRIIYRLGDEYYQNNGDGTVSQWIPAAKDSGDGRLEGPLIHTQARQLSNGKWALFNPVNNKQVSALSDTRPHDSPPPVVPPAELPPGMHELRYPDWAITHNPGVATQLTASLARLYSMFGQGDPATPDTPAFPFNTVTGQDSGIDRYDDLRKYFQHLEHEFDTAATSFHNAVQTSKFDVQNGRRAINDGIDDFNRTAAMLPPDSWPALIEAESGALGTASQAVQTAAASSPHPLMGPPDPAQPGQPPVTGPGAPLTPAPVAPVGSAPPPVSPVAPAVASPAGPPGGGVGGGPGSGLGLPGGGLPGLGALTSPLGALAGLNPLARGIPGLGSLPGLGGQPAPAAPTPVAAADAPGGIAPAAAVAPIASTDVPASVKLPDGTTVGAPNSQAAAAAQNALDKASPGGDAAHKAYTGVMDLPGDGKPLGVKVDPADLQAGDVLKWHDKTMVAVGPGLVADAIQPGVTHLLQDVLNDSNGFEGIFRPDTHTPAAAPPAPPTIPPPSNPAPQPAPPSPFETVTAVRPNTDKGDQP
jgi:hypothetical protein